MCLTTVQLDRGGKRSGLRYEHSGDKRPPQQVVEHRIVSSLLLCEKRRSFLFIIVQVKCENC